MRPWRRGHEQAMLRLCGQRKTTLVLAGSIDLKEHQKPVAFTAQLNNQATYSNIANIMTFILKQIQRYRT